MTLVTSAILMGLSVVGLLFGGALSSGNSGTSGLEAARANSLINQQLSSTQQSGSSFLLIFAGNDRPATDPGFRSEVEAALTPIQNDPRVTGVPTPDKAPNPPVAPSPPSKDGRQAPVRVAIKPPANQPT